MIGRRRRPLGAVHFDYEGHPLCEAPAAGALVVERAEYVTCPTCAQYAARFVDRRSPEQARN